MIPIQRVLYGASVAALLAACTVAAQPFTITDGDTIRMSGHYGDERIRLWGIDAPEMGQPCTVGGAEIDIGQAAREQLATIIGDGRVICTRFDIDRYGRSVSACQVDGLDLGAAMVRSGWALDYEAYSDGAYADEQAAAQADGLGMWRGQCMAPWDWRRR